MYFYKQIRVDCNVKEKRNECNVTYIIITTLWHLKFLVE